MKNRDAIATIKGYFYQFDLFIHKILEQRDNSTLVVIEGTEDVDIKKIGESELIQCKYYEETEYNHSVIKRPICLMLAHFARTDAKERTTNYKIYGYYKSGHDKLPPTIDSSFAIDNFFTYIHDKKEHKYHEELKLSNSEIDEFLKHLTIDINAIEYSSQTKSVVAMLRNHFSCDEFEAEHYYNNALRLVKELSIKRNVEERSISKREFISKINDRDALFNALFIAKKGLENYCAILKKKYFSPMNISPYERFFLIEYDNIISEADLKALLLKISEKWRNPSPRAPESICPYVFIKNLPYNILLNIKKALQSDGFFFGDGYDFKDADFSIKSICRQGNEVKLKIINEDTYIDDILRYLTSTREIYQFYVTNPFYSNDEHKHIKIKIQEVLNINDII